MPFYQYLIIGGGMTADAAARAIRACQPDSSIGLISMEPDPPYDRPPLTKGLWQGKPVEDIWRKTDDLAVAMHLGRKVQRLDPDRSLIVDDTGMEYQYEKLLLATGGTPRRLPFDDGTNNERVIYYRTLADYRRLQNLARKGQRLAVIGGGFIGAELAAALAMHNSNIVMIFPEVGIGASRFPSELALFLNDYYAEKGVEVLPNQMITGWEKGGEELVLQTQSGRNVTGQQIKVDALVAGLGIEPNVHMADSAGLKVDNGIIVDEFLRTSNPNIYAAGDVANFYNPALDTRLRVEHEDNALTMGQMAGRAMAGDPAPYNHQPFFYSDLFDLGYEAVGDLNADLEIVEDWIEEPYQKGVIYYLKKDRVRGVLLWNVWNQVGVARKLIAESPVKSEGLSGRITG